MLKICLTFCDVCKILKGMKKESILTEEERKQKWEKIRENRAKRQYRPEESHHDSSSNSPSPVCESSRKQPGTRSRPSSGRTSVVSIVLFFTHTLWLIIFKT